MAYTNCASNNKDSVPQTIESVDAIIRLIDEYPNDLQFATSAAGLYEISTRVKMQFCNKI